MSYDTYIQSLKSGIGQRIIRLEFLDKNNQVTGQDTYNVLDGTLSTKLDANARRNCSLVLANHKGLYTPNEDSNIWINGQFRLYTGRRINDEDYLNLRGTFIVSNPVLDSNFSNLTASIQGLDKWEKLNGTLGGIIEETYVVAAGESIYAAVKGVLQKTSDTLDPMVYPSNYVTPNPIVKEPGANYAEILIELANLYSWEVFYDIEGRLRFQPPIDPLKESAVWDFSTNEITYRGSSHSYSLDKIKNVVKVCGDNINFSTVKGIAEDTNIFSPFSIGKIGRVPHIISDDLINTVDLANQRAEYELKKLITLQESGNIKSLPIDIINEGDVITIEDKNNDFHRDRYQVQDISENLRSNGEMTLNVWKERGLF